jgi:phosphohistidine phosphatase
MTELWVIRHGVAVEREGRYREEERPLTTVGSAEMRRVARGLRRLGVRFDHLLHSPLRRAVETAELLTPLLEGTSRVTARLVASPTEALLREIEGERVAVVGHEPYLSELIAWMVIGNRDRAASFALKKGAVASLAGEPRPGGMVLLSVLPPAVLGRVRRRA